MANFLHDRQFLSAGDIAVLNCDTQCNFMLLDDSNFSRYKMGSSYEYYGGFFQYFPARITVPRTTAWNVVVDLGGGSATIRHSISYIRG